MRFAGPRILLAAALLPLACGRDTQRTNAVQAAPSAPRASLSARDALHLTQSLTALDGCDGGRQAFKDSVYTLIRGHCTNCHDSGGRGPNFAVDDLEQSYARVLRYQNFDNVAASRFVKKGGSMHCLTDYGFDCATHEADVALAVNDWWTNGESQCPAKGKLFSPGKTLPESLPNRDDGFTKMRWDLGGIDVRLRRTYLELEAQQFVSPGDGVSGAYQFRAPRLEPPNSALNVRGIRILVNGKYDTMADGYTGIDVGVAPGTVPTDTAVPAPFPVLSSRAQIVLQDRAAGDEISVSFDALDPIATPTCRALDTFKAKVMPALAARHCYNCHSGGAEHEPGTAPANQRFSLNLPPEELCRQFVQRIDRNHFRRSPLVTYPLNGANDHPRVFITSGEVMDNWGPWMAEETAPVAQ